MGGVASGKARRAQKTLREYADLLLSMSVSDTRKYNKLSRMGIKPEEIDNKMLMLVALFNAACDGDVAAEKEMRSIIGEDTSQDKDNGLLEDLIKGLRNE